MANETSIRQGLMYAISTIQDQAPLGDHCSSSDDAESHALMCSLFSAITIGGLMLGYPVATVARHMDFARRCKERLCNLPDKSPTTVVPALILYAMSHAFIGSERSDQEYRETLLQAKAIHNGAREKDPLVSCFTAYRNFYDCIGLMTLAMIESNSPFSAFGRVMDTAGMTLRTERARRFRQEISRGGQGMVHSTQKAHPCFVLVDATLLVLRFAHNVGDGSSTFNQVHDYLASELERSVRVDAGALVVTGIADLLIVAKARLLRTDGLLPLANLISNNLHQLPGLRRYDKGLIAIQSLAVFRLLDQRERYESLRGVLDSGPPFVIPHFDDCLPGVSLCHVPVVNHTCGLILKLNSLDGVVGVRSAAILAEFEARETSR